MIPCGSNQKIGQSGQSVRRGHGGKSLRGKKKGHVLLNVCAAVLVTRLWGVKTERPKMSRLSPPFWMDGRLLHQKTHPKNRTFHSTASKWIGGLYKAICRMEDSTWMKLRLLKVLLRCLCRLSEGREDWGDGSGDCSLWNGSFWFWIAIKKPDQ